MPRPAGFRNHDFDEKRASLLDALTDFAVSAELRRPSLRQFTIAVHQSEPTLRHYFTDRQGLVIDILEHISQRASPIGSVVSAPANDVASAVDDYVRITEPGLRDQGYARAHAFGLVEGLADELVGRVYLEKMLNPSLNDFSEKLKATPGGPRDPTELMAATLAATGPLFMLGPHQELFGGRTHIPLDVSSIFGIPKGWTGKALTPSASL